MYNSAVFVRIYRLHCSLADSRKSTEGTDQHLEFRESNAVDLVDLNVKLCSGEFVVGT